MHRTTPSIAYAYSVPSRGSEYEQAKLSATAPRGAAEYKSISGPYIRGTHGHGGEPSRGCRHHRRGPRRRAVRRRQQQLKVSCPVHRAIPRTQARSRSASPPTPGGRKEPPRAYIGDTRPGGGDDTDPNVPTARGTGPALSKRLNPDPLYTLKGSSAGRLNTGRSRRTRCRFRPSRLRRPQLLADAIAVEVIATEGKKERDTYGEFNLR